MFVVAAVAVVVVVISAIHKFDWMKTNYNAQIWMIVVMNPGAQHTKQHKNENAL